MEFPLRAYALLFLCIPVWAVPAAAAEEGDSFDPLHHTEDGVYLDFEPFGKVELPRIFVVRAADGTLGYRVFSSTARALRSGVFVTASDDAHHDTASADVEALIDGGTHLSATLVPSDGGEVLLDLSVTRHLVFALLASSLLVWAFLRLAAVYRAGTGSSSVPRGRFLNLLEVIIIFIRDDVAKPNLGDRYRDFLPFLLTVFFFILTCNLFGLVPFGATATSNLTITAVLAACTFFLTQLNGSKAYWQHVFWPPGMAVPVKLLLIPTEIMGLFAKPIALAIRLFANMTAGHLVILSLIGMIFTFGALFGPIAGYGVAPVSIAFALFVGLLEILIATIQAYIFTVLSALFIGMAIAEHSHEGSHGSDVHAQAH